jgi:hypothetical protein
MKERPILFSTAMVQAIMNAQKTQTRRTISASRSGECSIKKKLLDFNEIYPNGSFGVKVAQKEENQDGLTKQLWRVAPPYQAGDLLWVRENHQITYRPFMHGKEILVEYSASEQGRLELKKRELSLNMLQRMIASPSTGIYGSQNPFNPDREPKTRPSIHMPKAAARIWLKVAGVRVERLKDISQEDAVAEGVKAYPPFAIGYFKNLWESINGEASWNANPWVWVVAFELVSTTGKPEQLVKAAPV